MFLISYFKFIFIGKKDYVKVTLGL